MLLLPSPDFLQIVYRVELGVLVGRWMQPVTPEQLQTGYAALLDAASAWQCRWWLIDGRRRTHSHKGDSRWMMDAFFPQLASRLGGKAYLAYLFTPSHLQELEAAAEVPKLEYFNDLPYQVERFIEEQPAMQWLAQRRLLEQVGSAVAQ
ncbi:hypothetical protein LJ737_03575 [Hymenobacter sp. 15J16-1T3B]|uniref:hypothetical protein n=1 Tax=Hymenobacter sp. 15J16-1T3B TaxID=2886941 RepID=UPI001D114352|nr:hypothetical protein [Hymenobacter sp. 15J16-1T3B]MCC3156300.1 hypothetical protein [Hymenobacter sp. 15J16-1T3B]